MSYWSDKKSVKPLLKLRGGGGGLGGGGVWRGRGSRWKVQCLTVIYRLVSISSACDSHTEESTSPVDSWKGSFFSGFSRSERV